jgi:hypothetical protein
MEIKAKVAAVLSETQVAVNAGSKKGIQLGDAVTFWKVTEVQDPDTKEHLGSVRTVVLRLSISEVSELMAIAIVPSKRMTFSQTALGIPSEPQVRLVQVRSSLDGTFTVQVGNEVTITTRSGAQSAESELA